MRDQILKILTQHIKDNVSTSIITWLNRDRVEIRGILGRKYIMVMFKNNIVIDDAIHKRKLTIDIARPDSFDIIIHKLTHPLEPIDRECSWNKKN